MDYYDYRPHALAGILFLVVIVISSSVAVSRRKVTFAHVSQIVGWALVALLCFLGAIGSAGPPNTSWIGLTFWSGLLFFWLRFGLRGLKAMTHRKDETEGNSPHRNFQAADL